MAKWLAKGHTVRRDLTPRSEIPGYSRPLLALQETNIRFFSALSLPTPPRALAQACRPYTGLRPLAPESTSLSLLVHLPGRNNATHTGEEGKSRARNQSTIYCKGKARGPPASHRPGLWPAPIPGELCLLQIRKERTEESAEPTRQRTSRRGEQEVENPGFCTGPTSGHRGELNRV